MLHIRGNSYEFVTTCDTNSLIWQPPYKLHGVTYSLIFQHPLENWRICNECCYKSVGKAQICNTWVTYSCMFQRICNTCYKFVLLQIRLNRGILQLVYLQRQHPWHGCSWAKHPIMSKLIRLIRKFSLHSDASKWSRASSHQAGDRTRVQKVLSLESAEIKLALIMNMIATASISQLIFKYPNRFKVQWFVLNLPYVRYGKYFNTEFRIIQ